MTEAQFSALLTRAGESGPELKTRLQAALEALSPAAQSALSSLQQRFASPETASKLQDTVIFALTQALGLSLENLEQVAKNQQLCAEDNPLEDCLTAVQVFAVLTDAIQRGLSRAQDLQAVTQAIEAGNRLQIDLSRQLPRGMKAGYSSESNTLKLAELDIRRLFQRSLIVHEALHAADDLHPQESPLPEDQDGQLFAYESELNAYLAEAEYRQAYDFQLDTPDRFARNTIQERADAHVTHRQKGMSAVELQTSLRELKAEILRIYQRNYQRAYGPEFDYLSYQKTSDGIPERTATPCDQTPL